MISMAWICYIKIDEIPEVTLELKKKKNAFDIYFCHLV